LVTRHQYAAANPLKTDDLVLTEEGKFLAEALAAWAVSRHR
jgi:hypothetical protein